MPIRLGARARTGRRVVLAASMLVGACVSFAAGPRQLASAAEPAILLTPDADRPILPNWEVSPDGAYAVLRSLTGTGQIELWSVPTDGSDVPRRLHPNLGAGINVTGFKISDDSQAVVFRADLEQDEAYALYWVPIDDPDGLMQFSEAPSVESPVLPGFEIVPGTSTHVVYRRDTSSGGGDETSDLFFSSGGTATKMTNLDLDRQVTDFVVSASTGSVVIRADALNAGEFDLFSIDLDDGPAKLLTTNLSAGESVHDFMLSRDGESVAYEHDSAAGRAVSTVPVAGGEPFTALSAAGGADVEVAAAVGDQQWLVYRQAVAAGEETALWSVPFAGGTATRLTQARAHTQEVDQVGVTTDGRRVIYIGDDSTTDDASEVWSVPADGSAADATRLAAMDATSDVGSFIVSPINHRVAYNVDVDDDGSPDDGRPDQVFEVADGTGSPVGAVLPARRLDIPDISTPASGTFSPDGSSLIYAHGDEDESTIVRSTLTGEVSRVDEGLSGTAATGIVRAVPAPDGWRVVFASDEDGEFGLWSSAVFPFEQIVDTDGDGVPDATDNCPTTLNPEQNPDACDTDLDEVPNGLDNCQDVPNPDQLDGDGDGSGDACDPDPTTPDTDLDDDGVVNGDDNCPEDANPGQEDLDHDELGDVCDDDRDGDGVDNVLDAFPDDPAEDTDTDGDGTGNNADPDDDDDGIDDDADLDDDNDTVDDDVDNCPGHPNTDQADADTDGIGDACDNDAIVATDLPEGASRYEPFGPIRVLDTRDTPGLMAGETYVDVDLEEFGIPTDGVVAVMGTVTMTESALASFVTVGPVPPGGADTGRPTVSSGNVPRPLTRANGFVSAIGEGGDIRLYLRNPGEALIDISGLFVEVDEPVSGGRIVAMEATTRILETRPEHEGPGDKTPIPAEGTIRVQATGPGLAPEGAAAVVVNIGLINPEGASYLTAWRSGKRPTTSVTNTTDPAGDPVSSALAVVELDEEGGFLLFSKARSNAYVDMMAWVTPDDAPASTAGVFVPLIDGQKRAFDTRPEQASVPGPKGKLAAASDLTISFDSTVGLPGSDELGLVVANVTGTETDAVGFVTAYSAGTTRPLASMLNLGGAPVSDPDTRPNLAFLPVNAEGDTTLFTKNGTHLLADVLGWVVPE